jgi:hypothetical protein
MIESKENNEPDAKQPKQNNRGTRRQQKYRAKQKLLQLCELASAQAVNFVETNEKTNDRTNVHLIEVGCFNMSSTQ